jgi:CheY-like chemotaxis protein
MSGTSMGLAGKRILIVEDELMVAVLIEELLADCGCSTIGPFSTVAVALEAAQTERFDLAVLDVNLDGEMVYPVANFLAERRIPFLFLSGYGDQAVPPGHSDWKVCAKPFKLADLAKMMTAALEAAAH